MNTPPVIPCGSLLCDDPRSTVSSDRCAPLLSLGPVSGKGSGRILPRDFNAPPNRSEVYHVPTNDFTADRVGRAVRWSSTGPCFMSIVATEPKCSDVELIRRVALRDHDAFLELYDRHAPRTLGVIRRVIYDSHDAEDVLQLVMHELWTRHAERYDPVLGSVDAWIYRLARSRAIDRVRANVRRSAVEQQALLRMEISMEPRLQGDIQLALKALDENLLAPMLLAFQCGMTREQISEQLDIPIGTVKTRLRSGVTQMRAALHSSEVA